MVKVSRMSMLLCILMVQRMRMVKVDQSMGSGQIVTMVVDVVDNELAS